MHIVHTESSGGWGGQEIRVLTEAQGMLARGHRVSVVAPAETRIYQEALERGVPAVALPIAKKRLSGACALRRWFVAERPDVVNTHSSTDSWLSAIACLGRAHAPAIVRTRHISAPVTKNFPTRWLYQKATARIVTTGERIRRQMIDDNGYDPATIVSVPTGVDSSRFAPGDRTVARTTLGLPTGDSVWLGIVATLRSWKGHEYLIDALVRLPDKRVRLLIVGDGPQRAAIERLVAERGLAERVVIAGNQRDVVPWLHALDIFVLPSYANEGVPQAIVQAMLCALPVVSTRVGCIDEIVRHDDTGILIEPKNSERIVHAVRRLIDNAPLRQQMGARGRVVAQTNFGVDAMLDNMERVFRSAAEHSK